MKKNKISTLLSILLLSTYSFAKNAEKNLETSATLENTCMISADNINFGPLSSPLNMQTSNSQMRIFCSKDANYRINLSYGGVSLTSSGSNQYSVGAGVTTSSSQNYWWGYTTYPFLVDNVQIGTVQCNLQKQVYFSNLQVANTFGYNSLVFSDIDGPKLGICNGNRFVQSSLSKLSPASQEMGFMKGLIKGDKVAYKIIVPGESVKVWNNIENSYTSVGIGTEQILNFNSQIIPDHSSSKYPAPDLYSDTVIADITY